MSKNTIRTHGNPISGQKDGKKAHTDLTPSYLSSKKIELLGKKLWISSHNGNTAETKTLLEGGAPVNWQNLNGITPLHIASLKGTMDIVMLLVDHKANLNIRTKWKNTPLICATFHNRLAIVRALVEAGADTTMRDFKNRTAAEGAKIHGYDAIAEYLTNKAQQIRFHQSSRRDNGQLNCVKGRSLRALERDLKETGFFVNHMLHRLEQFCTDKRR